MEENFTTGIQKDMTAKPAEELKEEDVQYFVTETKKWIGREIELEITINFWPNNL